MRKGLSSFGVAVIALAAGATASHAATFVVDRFDEPEKGGTACTSSPSDCSLRGALADADLTKTEADLVQLSAGEYRTDGLFAESPVTIAGTGARQTVIHPSEGSAGFSPEGAGAVELRDLAIRGARAGGPAFGGGIFLREGTRLTLQRTALIDNQASGDPQFGSQKYYGIGGGIRAESGSELLIENSLISGNAAMTGVTGNGAWGGGVAAFNSSTVIRNSTISGNVVNAKPDVAGTGGGIYLSEGSALELDNVTLAGNVVSGGLGSAGGNLFRAPTGLVRLRGSIIALGSNLILGAPSPGANCNTPSITLGGNLEDLNECGLKAGDLVSVDPLLGALADNGGSTDTRAIAAASPAVNLAGSCGLAADQRGVPRSDGACDAGAFELAQSVPGLSQPGSPRPSLSAVPTPPSISKAAQSHASWSEGNKLAALSRKRKRGAPVGTTFSFTLDQPASVRFAFTQKVGGRKVRARCIAKNPTNRHKRACKRTLTRGTLTVAGRAGANRLAFQGRLSLAKKLPLGRYTLVITAATTAGQRSSAHSLRFTIVK